MIDKPIIGAWILKSWSVKNSRGDILFELDKAVGTIIYSENGYMSANIMAVGQKYDGLNSEIFKIFDHEGFFYLGYSGKYIVRSENKVEHHLALASAKEWVGSVQPRNFKIDGNLLIINTTIEEKDGSKLDHTLIWERA